MTRKQRKAAPRRFMVVASTGSGPYPHPVEVTLHPAGPDSIVGFSIGPHAANAGGLVSLATVVDAASGELNPAFEREFDAAELHWLVPLLARLQVGEDVEAAIVAAYRERHGKQPVWRG